MKNPADVSFFGKTKEKLKGKLEKKQAVSGHAVSSSSVSQTAGSTPTGIHTKKDQPISISPNTAHEDPVSYGVMSTSDVSSEDEYAVNTDEFAVDIDDDIEETEQELQDALDRLPEADADAIRQSFEGIITRQVRHDKPDHFLDLWECVDIILSDLDENSDHGSKLQDEFYNNIEAEIQKHPAEFKRALSDIKSTTIAVKRVDPLTGQAFEDREELVENDAVRLTSYYKHVVTVFAGASDMVKHYINRRMSEHYDSDSQAIARIAAVGYCLEIVQAMELWAEDKTDYLLSNYGSQRYRVSEENRTKWDRIEGNTKPYIERNLSIQASITRQNKEYDNFPRHIITADDGWAYLNLNDLEKKVVATELGKAGTVAWYRNQSRNLNASLSIPYELNGEWENMYPDFIFFTKTADGIARVIVDPHGDWLGDSIAKLKGYVEYIKDHPDMFSSVITVADEKGGEYRQLDLMVPQVQNAINTFTGSSAKELFTGIYSKKYHVKQD